MSTGPLTPGTAVGARPLEHAKPALGCNLLTPVVLLLLLLLLAWAGGAHCPSGAHKATHHKVDAFNMAEHHAHELRHEFLHLFPLSVLVVGLLSNEMKY
jgi:hypothetical protein